VLGPELINFTVRPTPIFLEGSASIQLTQQAARDLGLKDGQVVQGVIAARGDLLKLLVNNQELDWPASGRFNAGDKLDFRVEQSIFGRALVPLGRPVARAAAQPLSPRLLSLMHRPAQPSMLTGLFKPGGLDAVVAQLGAHEQPLLASLMLSTTKLSPQEIRRGLLNSGLFGEARIAAGIPVQGPDIKQLLRLLIRSIPPQGAAAAELDSAIDEVESKQLDSLQAQQSRELNYSFVLPFADANPVEMELYREPAKGVDGAEEWVINLHTESPSLGKLWLKTTLKSASAIEMIMWAPYGNVAQRAQASVSELESELQRFGLALQKLEVLSAPRPALSDGLSGSGQVVDVST